MQHFLCRLINTLTFAALSAMTVAGVLWMASFFEDRTSAAPAMLQHETLGFLLPAILFGMHWVFWRARGADLQTRLSLAAGALLLAAFVTLEAMRAEGAPNWLGALAGAASFALAIGINFAPGVTNTSSQRRSDLEVNLHRHRRGEERRQAR